MDALHVRLAALMALLIKATLLLAGRPLQKAPVAAGVRPDRGESAHIIICITHVRGVSILHSK